MCKCNPEERIGDCNVCSRYKNNVCEIENVDEKMVIYWLIEGYDYADATKADCPFWWFDDDKYEITDEFDEYKKFEECMTRMKELNISVDELISLLNQRNDINTALTYLKKYEKILSDEKRNNGN